MSDYNKRIRELHKELNNIAVKWALGKKIDFEYTKNVRQEAILLNHKHYYEHIPVYKQLAKQAGIGVEASIKDIILEMMSTDHIFKSYPQSLLDESNFSGMNEWLRKVFDRDFKIEVDDIENVDDWLSKLDSSGIRTVFSSGTSGHMSFVPRDSYNWSLLTGLAMSYMPLFNMQQGVARPVERLLARTAASIMSPEKFSSFFETKGMRKFDGFFLSFSGGTQGTQVVGQVLSKIMGSSTFLFDMELSPSIVRSIVRGPTNEEEQKKVDHFLEATVRRRTDQYERVLNALELSSKKRRRSMVFGAPFMIKEFCDWIVSEKKEISLPPGSILFHGGGWKTFEGDRIEEEVFLKLVDQALGIKPPNVGEGYSMTEAQVLYPRCKQGRFHIPPITETVIFDEALEPIEGDDIYGALGFLDPFAICYPGFIITGDNVRRRNDNCPCGITGMTISDIGRVAGREVKGCGGIMAAMQG